MELVKSQFFIPEKAEGSDGELRLSPTHTMKPHRPIASAISLPKSIRPQWLGSVAALGFALVATMAPVHAATYDVDIKSPKYTLYSDPYNGNEIKLGGFSGLYPVPGQT